jgi:hypothetical protein
MGGISQSILSAAHRLIAAWRMAFAVDSWLQGF